MRLTIRPSTFQTTPCDCGFSQWHLLALGLLEPWVAKQFLDSTTDAPGGLLLDDMLEHTTAPIPVFWRPPPWSTVGLSVEQMCRIQCCTLLGHYIGHGALDWPMHPAVAGFEAWLSKAIEEELVS